MESTYKKIAEFVVVAGKRLATRAGKIADVGVRKKYVTEEDVAIERGIAAIIANAHPTHALWAEEEHEHLPDADDIWIADPISGTKTFIEGGTEYSIAIAHMRKGVVQFSAVYHPPTDELFFAHRGQGATCNGRAIRVSNPSTTPSLYFKQSPDWNDALVARRALGVLEQIGNVESVARSSSFYCCQVACGRRDGIFLLSKDGFPELVSSVIVTEAGGVFTNGDGGAVTPTDRMFIGASSVLHEKMFAAIRESR